MSEGPLVTVCVPHWQALTLIRPCLRAIRKHTLPGLAHVVVVDNGSRDASLDYLRGLSWIELVERPEEGPQGWPENAFSAWDVGLERAQTPFFLSLHSDVFVLDPGWLDPLLAALEEPTVAGAGPWKQERGGLYGLQKRLVAGVLDRLRGRQRHTTRRHPRDYCALYRSAVVRGLGHPAGRPRRARRPRGPRGRAHRPRALPPARARAGQDPLGPGRRGTLDARAAGKRRARRVKDTSESPR